MSGFARAVLDGEELVLFEVDRHTLEGHVERRQATSVSASETGVRMLRSFSAVRRRGR